MNHTDGPCASLPYTIFRDFTYKPYRDFPERDVRPTALEAYRARNTAAAFCPPNPKLLVRTVRTRAVRATFGT